MSSFATFALLTLAIVGLWLGQVSARSRVQVDAWLAPLLVAVVAALASGIVTPAGLIWIAAFAAATRQFSRAEPGGARRVIAAIAIVVLAAGLMAHRLPGFNNPRVLHAVQISADGIPFGLHLNFDKTLVGLFLLGFCHARIARAADWRDMLAKTAPIAAGTILLLIGVALACGYVRFDPKWPASAWLWLWANLCLTCFAEEALFRGFVQAELTRRWQHRRGGACCALAVAALLFGLAHAAGGATYVALSSVAGLGYGWAYRRSGGRIEASILTHFALNAVHFLAFTYPALQYAR